MEFLGIKIGKGKNAADQPAQVADKAKVGLVTEIKRRLKKLLGQAKRYQVSIIALAVAGLLALTTLRMLHYVNPPVDYSQVQKNMAQYQQAHIDPKIVQKIDQLQSSGTSTNSDIESGRTNPFSE